MFGTMKSGASAYAKVGVETGVISASPHKLISMLFEGADVAIAGAIAQMNAGDVATKGALISKAINIIDNGLCVSLDMEAGGEIAANLSALYQYMVRRLLEGNLKNQAEPLEEVRKLLADLKGAWDAIGAGAAAPEQAPAPTLAARSPYDALVPKSAAYVSAT